jgi:hypothetical protein
MKDPFCSIPVLLNNNYETDTILKDSIYPKNHTYTRFLPESASSSPSAPTSDCEETEFSSTTVPPSPPPVPPLASPLPLLPPTRQLPTRPGNVEQNLVLSSVANHVHLSSCCCDQKQVGRKNVCYRNRGE